MRICRPLHQCVSPQAFRHFQLCILSTRSIPSFGVSTRWTQALPLRPDVPTHSKGLLPVRLFFPFYNIHPSIEDRHHQVSYTDTIPCLYASYTYKQLTISTYTYTSYPSTGEDPFNWLYDRRKERKPRLPLDFSYTAYPASTNYQSITERKRHQSDIEPPEAVPLVAQ